MKEVEKKMAKLLSLGVLLDPVLGIDFTKFHSRHYYQFIARHTEAIGGRRHWP